VHVSDLARAHVLALEHPLSAGESIAVNLASGQGASVRQVIETACDVASCKILVREIDRRSGDPSVLVAEAALAREVLGWSAQRSGQPWPRTHGAGTGNGLELEPT
jgi:UDP-arabinose 4-epimerase